MTTLQRITVTEARRLSRVSARLGSMVQSSETRTFACPLDMEPGRMAHRVTVWHQAGGQPTAPQIAAAFVEHYRSEHDSERCPHAPPVGAR